MIKDPQIKEIKENQGHYITAIGKVQIDKLLQKKHIQLELFDEKVKEVIIDGVRYILKRNPYRALELQNNRNSKLAKIQNLVLDKNEYLKNSSRASVDVAFREISEKIKKIKLSNWLSCKVNDRTIELIIDPEKLLEDSQLDGCYVLKTDLTAEQADAETIHKRYKQLAQVEQGFRTMKTGHLELRPIHVRKEENTKGHVFIVMLAYLIVQHLQEKWRLIENTVEEGINELKKICTVELIHQGGRCLRIPDPSSRAKELLEAIGVKLPLVIPKVQTKVDKRTKLIQRRK